MNTKYYVEIGETSKMTEYLIQSKWFDDFSEAIKFAKSFDYMDSSLFIRIMYSEFENDEPTDILLLEYLI